MIKRNQDESFMNAKHRVEEASGKPNFLREFNDFANRWRGKGCPEIMKDIDISFDFEAEQQIYKGFYYDLRELCDKYLLPWPHSGYVIQKMLNAIEAGKSIDEELESDFCPPEEYWTVFRMSKQGLGLPRKEELDKLEDSDWVTDNKQIKRNLYEGLPYHLIGKITHYSERHVKNIMKECREYWRNGKNFLLIVERAGLNHLDLLRIFGKEDLPKREI